MQAFLKVLACAALSGSLIVPGQGAALPYQMQARQIGGGVSGNLGASISVDTAAISTPTLSLPDLSLPNGSGSLPGVPDLTGNLPALSTPSVGLPDASLPDVPTASLPDASLPDATLPTGSLPDASLPDATLPTGSLPGLGDLSGSLPGLGDLSGSLPGVPSVTTPTVTLADGAVPTIDPSAALSSALTAVPTSAPDASLPDLPTASASAIFNSLSSALGAIPTPAVVAQAQAFETFVSEALAGLADTFDGNFDNLPTNLPDAGDLNLPDGIPQPFANAAGIFENAINTFLSTIGFSDIPSPFIPVVPVGDASGSAEGSFNGSASVSSPAGSADANAVSTADADGSTTIVPPAGFDASDFQFTNLFTTISSTIDSLLGAYGVDGYQAVIPSGFVAGF